MILREAIIGGTYYPEWIEGEAEKKEADRVAFVYKAITNRERIALLEKSNQLQPNSVDVMKLAVTEIRNIFGANGEKLDTVDKLLDYKDAGHVIDYIILIAGRTIWQRQNGTEEQIKN